LNFIFKGEDLQKKVYREMEEIKTDIKEALKGGSKENSLRSSKDTGSVKKNDGGSSLKNSSAASLGSNQNKPTEKKKSLRNSK